VPGFSSHQKINHALGFLAYGTSADQVDEYIWMAKSMVFETDFCLCFAIIACFLYLPSSAGC
jgi:hypothetical protein